MNGTDVPITNAPPAFTLNGETLTVTMDGPKEITAVFGTGDGGIIHCDINDDGAIDAADDTARQSGDPEYLRTEDAQDNGAGTIEYVVTGTESVFNWWHFRYEDIPKRTPRQVSDDLKPIHIGQLAAVNSIVALKGGSLSYSWSGGPALHLLSSKNLQDDMPNPFTLSASDTFPTQFYIHANENIRTECTTTLTVTYTPTDGSAPITDSLTLCVVPFVGFPHYFSATRDYMADYHMKYFTQVVTPADQESSEEYRVVVLPHERTAMRTFESYSSLQRGVKIDDLLLTDPGHTLYINGVYYSRADRILGKLVTANHLSPFSYKSNWGDREYSIIQPTAEARGIELVKGEFFRLTNGGTCFQQNGQPFNPTVFPTDPSLLQGITDPYHYMAISGIHDYDYYVDDRGDSDEWKPSSLIGIAKVSGSDKKVLFFAMTNAAFKGRLLGTRTQRVAMIGFLRDSGTEVSVYRLDGGSSLAMTLATPRGIEVVVRGVAHSLGFSRAISAPNNYFMFDVSN